MFSMHLTRNGFYVKDLEGYWYKNQEGVLVESVDEGKTWRETNEFKFGEINIDWELVKIR